jgi:hypothetical protein
MAIDANVYYAASGDVAVWIDAGGSIHLRVRERQGDPVELSEHEAIELADLLRKLAQELGS